MRLLEDDVAIVGIACVFPDAPGVTAFWENILSARCSITDHPMPAAQRLVDPDSPYFERSHTIRGGYLRDLFTFEPLRYGIMPDSIEGGNINHFMALRLAQEALEDAGLEGDRLPRDRTNVIIGAGQYVNPGNTNWIQHGLVLDQTMAVLQHLHPDYTAAELEEIRNALRESLPPIGADTVPALVDNLLTGRISNRLDLKGANYNHDAACPSSLIAIDNGVQDLLLDRCDVAIVGGSSAGIPPQGFLTFSKLGALSHLPALRPFDRAADGTLMGEGAGLVVLKRRADADRDGDRVYAVIKGLGVSSDGRGGGMLAPRLEGEAMAIERAYRDAGVSPETVGLIEAHGTGIPLGDVTEIHALAKVFGPGHGTVATCGVGSVKSMIGHTLAAAGVAGFIKAALALYHKVLPPTANCDEPNPDLELGKTPFYISTETRPWIHGGNQAPRRAGVSAMGFGGINSHCVLEEHV